NAAWMAAAFVLSAYAGVVVANQSDPGATGLARRAFRAVATPMVVESSSYDATARVPVPPPRPATGAIVVRSRRRYGTCDPHPTMPRMPSAYANLTTRQIRRGVAR